MAYYDNDHQDEIDELIESVSLIEDSIIFLHNKFKSEGLTQEIKGRVLSEQRELRRLVEKLNRLVGEDPLDT